MEQRSLYGGAAYKEPILVWGSTWPSQVSPEAGWELGHVTAVESLSEKHPFSDFSKILSSISCPVAQLPVLGGTEAPTE